VSIDFYAELELGARFESAERLCAQLAAEPRGLREAIERFRHRSNPTRHTAPIRAEPGAIVIVDGTFLSTKVFRLCSIEDVKAPLLIARPTVPPEDLQS
jgi:hypothetical protein